MGKRFTATEKWHDPWFRSLPPDQKHGWNYLIDNCDAAGVIDLDRGLADFLVGETVDWDGLIKSAGHRIAVTKKGKLWLTGFIQFQYGTLSENCHPHKAIFKLLAKHRLLETYQKGTCTLQDKEQDKDQDKDSEGGTGGEPKTPAKKFIPPTVDEVASYCRERKNGVDAQQFVNFYKSKGWKVGKTPMVDWKASVITWERSGNDTRAGPGDPRGTKSAVAEFILRGSKHGES